METFFTISTHNGGFYYNLFYLIAFIVACAILVYEGWHRKYPLLTWMLIITSSVLFFIIGNKIFAYSPEQWDHIFDHFQFPETTNKTVLGGIIGGIAGVVMAKWWFRFKYSILDSFAIALPIAMAVSRVGCLLAGCCFGTPTDLPWAVNYPVNSIPYHVHLGKGLIDFTSATSLAIHPTQLYQIIFCLVIVLIIRRTRKFWKAPGNLFCFSILLYGCFRFISEFFRDPVANGVAGEIVWGLKYVQWGLLLAILLLTLYLIYRERFVQIKPKAATPVSRKCGTSVCAGTTLSNNLYRHLIYIVAIISIVWTGRDWFTPVEKMVIETILFAAILGVCWQMYKGFTIPQLRWVPVGLFVGCMIFMGQTFKNENLPDKSVYNTISLGGMMGRYIIRIEEEIMTCPGGYCSTPDPRAMRISYFDHRYGSGGIGFNRTFRFDEFQKASIGVRAYSGSDNVSVRVDTSNCSSSLYAQETNFSFQNFVLGFNPYAHYDWRGIGIGAGFHAGNFHNGFLPQFDIRLGPYDILFLKFKYADQSPGIWYWGEDRFKRTCTTSFFGRKCSIETPHPYLNFSIGTGFGLTNGASLRIGSATFAGTYITASIPIKNRLVIEPFYASKDGGSIKQFALTLHYRFGHKSMKWH